MGKGTRAGSTRRVRLERKSHIGAISRRQDGMLPELDGRAARTVETLRGKNFVRIFGGLGAPDLDDGPRACFRKAVPPSSHLPATGRGTGDVPGNHETDARAQPGRGCGEASGVPGIVNGLPTRVLVLVAFLGPPRLFHPTRGRRLPPAPWQRTAPGGVPSHRWLNRVCMARFTSSPRACMAMRATAPPPAAIGPSCRYRPNNTARRRLIGRRVLSSVFWRWLQLRLSLSKFR